MALQPGDTIGIIGGGQLARMLCMAAARLGFKTIVLDPAQDAPALQCANGAITASYGDAEALKTLAEASKVITYEFENVDVSALAQLDASTFCHPNVDALKTSQDRLVEKQFFNDLGIPTAPYLDIPDPDSLDEALEELGGHGILKTRRFGYDGKGQIRLSGTADPGMENAIGMARDVPCILEGLVPFEREISIIAARSPSGAIASYAPAENVHQGGILRTSNVPAVINDETHEQAIDCANKVLNALDYVGVIGIEFFVLQDGSLMANEYAPRVHNSGHWTEAACTVSQFELHIRAIAGLPLPDTQRHSDCEMVNLIGDDVDGFETFVGKANTLVHLYGKSECRPGRKMGHYTTISPRN